jgi:L-serine/L-threonine ammonia-lyase
MSHPSTTLISGRATRAWWTRSPPRARPPTPSLSRTASASETTTGTVETAGAASLARSIEAGHAITLERIDTIASSLAARRVADAAFAWTQKHAVVPVVVSDADAVRACLRFADDHQTVVEPACGAALSLAYDDHPALQPYARVAVVACGGVVVSLEKLAGWKAQFGV